MYGVATMDIIKAATRTVIHRNMLLHGVYAHQRTNNSSVRSFSSPIAVFLRPRNSRCCYEDNGINSSNRSRKSIFNNYDHDRRRAEQWFSSSSGNKTGNNIKTGQEHHSFFQEQMLELHREQKKHFGLVEARKQDSNNDDGNDDDGNNNSTVASTVASPSPAPHNDLNDQLKDWREEQTYVFGEALSDRDSNDTTCTNIKNQGDDEEIEIQARKEEREALFDFSSQERAAWGKPQHTRDAMMRRIIDEISLERSERESSTELALELEETMESCSSSSSSDVSSPSDASSPSSSHDYHHRAFSHVNKDGTGIHMVDVGKKDVTRRTAHARSEVWLPSNVLAELLSSSTSSSSSPLKSEELVGPKGPIFATAKVAGIMAAKRTSDLIPLCHPLPLDQVQLDIRLVTTSGKHDKGNGNQKNNQNGVNITTTSDNIHGSVSNGGGMVIIDCICCVSHKTGVEMEALTGATVAALTIYDMTKAVSHKIRIKETRLISKTGGKRIVGCA